ncbi:MAG: tRNA methyl transferase PRC-barrel domain-containing protein, partial [Oscillospiraceae bacterium]
QSYVLYNLKEAELAHILLPLGELDLPKSQLREIAAEAGIPVANRPESQDICFIPDGKYAEYIESHRNLTNRGFFVDEKGNKLGEHNGYYRYTKGQRKGLGIALGAPAFVTDIDNQSGNVTLSLNE